MNKDISKEQEINKMLDEYEIYTIEIDDIDKQFKEDCNKIYQQGRKDEKKLNDLMFKPTKEFCDNCKNKIRKDAIEEINKIIDDEIKDEGEAQQRKNTRYWTYRQELRYLKDRIKKELSNTK